MNHNEFGQFGSPDFPIHEVLGPRTRSVLENALSANTFIIKNRYSFNLSSKSLSSAEILAKGKQLTLDQIQLIRKTVNEPHAYYNGSPVFRRLPPEQDFAIQLHSDADSLDLMIGLENPSWRFYCGEENYSDWHWAGHIFKQIAKEAFPEYASPLSDGIWRKGVIAELQRQFDRKE